MKYNRKNIIKYSYLTLIFYYFCEIIKLMINCIKIFFTKSKIINYINKILFINITQFEPTIKINI